MKNIPKIWTGVILIKDGKVLIWKRTNTSLWNNKYWLPWGHLDFWESILECWIRETKEETWLNINMEDIHILDFTEDFFEDKHYITFFIIAEKYNWIISISEPDKHKEWEWLDWSEIIELWNNLLPPLFSLTQKYPSLKK